MWAVQRSRAGIATFGLAPAHSYYQLCTVSGYAEQPDYVYV